jgi:hypothetical protein
MQSYLDGGGRLYTTHYYYNWFTKPSGPPAFQDVAGWVPPKLGEHYLHYYVDSSFPKGQAYAAWLLGNVGAPSVTGSLASGVQIALTDTRWDVKAAGLPTYPDSTSWLYFADSPGADGGPPASYDTTYLSFNTPTTAPTSTHVLFGMGLAALACDCATGGLVETSDDGMSAIDSGRDAPWERSDSPPRHAPTGVRRTAAAQSSLACRRRALRAKSGRIWCGAQTSCAMRAALYCIQQ